MVATDLTAVDAERCRALARQAAAWIAAQDLDAVGTSIYAGRGGVALFRLFAGTDLDDDELRAQAGADADVLAARLDDDEESGLYVGLAGTAYVLLECSRMLGDERWIPAVRRAVDLLDDRARAAGGGRAWSSVTDVVSGTAGTGLALLALHRAGADERALDLAVAAADALLDVAEEAPGGLSWPLQPGYERVMPNFSHGTAGVAYFLAEASDAVGRADLLEAAVAGAEHLTAIARTDGDTCLVHHHTPDGTDLYYLGWCHGPVGTARLFEVLHRLTGDARWGDWLDRCARALLAAGIPEQRPEGFWNNVGQCCGNAGVAEFCLDARARTEAGEELDGLAARLVADIIARAAVEGDAARWEHAESRARPESLAAQPGFMQGAAGVASLLIRYARHLDGDPAPSGVRLPDNPFAKGRTP